MLTFVLPAKSIVRLRGMPFSRAVAKLFDAPARPPEAFRADFLPAKSIVRLRGTPFSRAVAKLFDAYLNIGCNFDLMSASAASVVFVPAR